MLTDDLFPPLRSASHAASSFSFFSRSCIYRNQKLKQLSTDIKNKENKSSVRPLLHSYIVSSGMSTVASFCSNPAGSGPKRGIRVFDAGAVAPF